MQGINEIVLEYVKKYSDEEKEFCPECLERGNKTTMFRPKGDKITYDKHDYKTVHKGVKKAAFCPVCGYSTLDGGTKPVTKDELEQRTAQIATENSLKHGAIGYLTSTSIFAKDITNCTFDNFAKDNDDRLKVARYVYKGAMRLSKGDNTHMILQGHTGSGKTHLAFAAIQEIFKQTKCRVKYRKRQKGTNESADAYRNIEIVFCSWPLLMKQIKDGFNDDQIKKATDRTVSALQTADIAVIDDLGAERDTDFNFEQIDNLMQIREDMPLIVTTNESFEDLAEKYDERTVSRIKAHSALIKFDDVADYRQGA